MRKTRIHLTIFSYQRRAMLDSLMDEVNVASGASKYDLSYLILDDGSDFAIGHENYVQFEHQGKPGFWRIWDYALKSVQNIEADIYVFLPTDFQNVDFERIAGCAQRYGTAPRGKDRPYVYNLVNDGRRQCWNLVAPVQVDQDTLKVGFTDCGFFTNRTTLVLLGHRVKQVNPNRFLHNPSISSGVGQQLTQRINALRIPIYLPVKSLCFHGDHPSTMHPEHRKNNPLISK